MNARITIAAVTAALFGATVLLIGRATDSLELPRAPSVSPSGGTATDTTDSALFRPIPRPGPGDWLDVHDEPGQTFEQFLVCERNQPDSGRNTIYLQPIWPFDSDRSPSLEDLRDFGERYFAMPAKLLPPVNPPKSGFHPRENNGHVQVLAGELLGYLMERIPNDAYCVLGVTMVDLYPDPSWNFVFGLASYAERVGVFSFVRYDPAFYGLARDDDHRTTVLRRSIKVLAHETGHMFGTAHCIYYHCVMNGSNHLAESDAQPIHLCPVCLRKLQHSVGFSPRGRYTNLREWYSTAGFGDEKKWVTARLRSIERATPDGPNPAR